MSILSYRPTELATARKIASDLRDGSEDLTIKSRDKMSSHGIAAKKVRERNDELNIQALSVDVDSADYFDEYDVDG